MTYGRMGTDREERINFPRMREYRLARTREQMKKDGLGALVTWEPWDIRYITGAYITIPTRWFEVHFCVLPVNGDPHLFGGCSGGPPRMREEMPWLKGKIFSSRGSTKLVRRKEELKSLVDTVAKILADHGVTNQPLGIDGSQSELILQEAFKDVGIKVVDAKTTMFDARKIKNRDEIECVRMACANAEAAFADIQDAIRPGVTECELVGIGMKRLYTLGADEAMEFVCVSGGLTNPWRVDFTDRQLRPHDLIDIDINGNSYQGYKSCYYRCFSCGKATPEQKSIYAECYNMLYAGLSGVKAGNTTWDVVKNWPSSPSYWGYETWEEAFGLAGAHGLGISLHEFPFFEYPQAKANPVTFEENMVLALETWTGKKGGKDGVRLEENVVVTKDGYDLLTIWPIEEVTECWT